MLSLKHVVASGRQPRWRVMLSILSVVIAFCGTAEAQNRRPNVIVFLVDDMGWTDFGAGPYGSKYYETPNMDALAAQGVLFTDAYSANPLCSPTRASILTGKYPARLGITSAVGHTPPTPPGPINYKPANPNRAVLQPESRSYLDPAEYTLAEALRDAGYATGHFGKWHLGLTPPHWPEEQGYKVAWHGTPDPGPPQPNGYFAPYSFREGTIVPAADGTYIVDQLTDEAIKFIEDHRDGPFLLSVWQFGVHGPWGHKEEYTKEFVNKKDPTGRHQNPIMASMLRSVDESLGRILKKLDELQLADDTIIIFASDNGGNVHSNIEEDEKARNLRPDHPRAKVIADYRKYAGFNPPTNNEPLRAGKGTLFEGGVRIPLVVRWPGKIAAGGQSSEVVSTIDFYPTLMELTGVTPKEPVKFDGISFASVLKDPSAKLNREALFNFFPHGGPGKPPGVSVRAGNWKLIRWYETSPNFPEVYELYDLSKDLGEKTNLASTHQDKVKELDQLIDSFLKETGAAVPIPNPEYRKPRASLN